MLDGMKSEMKKMPQRKAASYTQNSPLKDKFYTGQPKTSTGPGRSGYPNNPYSTKK